MFQDLSVTMKSSLHPAPIYDEYSVGMPPLYSLITGYLTLPVPPHFRLAIITGSCTAPLQMNPNAWVNALNLAKGIADDAQRAAIGASDAVAGTVSSVNWQQIGNDVQQITTNAASSVAQELERLGQEIHKVDWHQVGNDVHITAGKAASSVAQGFERLGQEFHKADWNQARRDFTGFWDENQQTIITAAAVCGGAAGGVLLMGPALGAAGFSSIGPVAGKSSFHGTDKHAHFHSTSVR